MIPFKKTFYSMLSEDHQLQVNCLVEQLYEHETNDSIKRLLTKDNNTSENTTSPIRKSDFDFDSKVDTSTLNTFKLEKDIILDEYRRYLGIQP